MPNWCSNRLEVCGTKEHMSEFYKIIDWSNGNFCMESFMPTPRKQTDNGGEELRDDWYEWRVSHWGTKWDVDSISSYESARKDDYYSIGYDTAWSPNVEFILTISKAFPNLSFTLEYEECGCQIAGEVKIQNGEELEHTPHPYYSVWFKLLEDNKFEFVEITMADNGSGDMLYDDNYECCTELADRLPEAIENVTYVDELQGCGEIINEDDLDKSLNSLIL